MSNMLKKLRAKPLMLLLLAAAATPSQAELIVNGDFETGDFTGWSQFGDEGFSGVSSSFSHNGNFGAYFGPQSAGGIVQQTIPLTVGQEYIFSFSLANQGLGDFLVSFGGTTLFALNQNDFLPFVPISFRIISNVSSADLAFQFVNPTGWWSLDDVSVVAVAVPEPSSWALMIGGFALAGSALRQRKRTVVRYA